MRVQEISATIISSVARQKPMVWASRQQLQGGKYVIEQVLGRGGFGITYKARHTMLNAFVVIKTPNDDLRNDPEYPKFIKRFREEGQRLEKLSENQHPNIVRVRDLFHEGGTYCLVMDFVQGDSLFNLVQKRGALPTQEAVKYISQIGDALKIVHQAGLVHRDAHPGNIMVQQDGKAVLIDFGIAGETVPITPSTQFFANPAFAPYEQMRGDRQPFVDVYSLAASLYYAVTNQLPETSINRKLYSMALVSPQQHISSISDKLNQAIVKGMELEPENRPQTMQEWLEMLTVAVTTWTSGYQLQNGKYTIEKVIAQGGFGITYLARNENQQPIVIKTLNEIVQKRPDFAKLEQDFLNEALKLAKCNHPHVVKVREVFQEGIWCMVMEYIEGENFVDRVVNRGVLSEAEAVGYIRQIGEALTVVHNNGLLHRDVKPANIIVRTNKREAVLIDFGIAREFVPSITQLHTPYLSHCFAPIEQYQRVAKRGAYTDVYALAATLYFLLTNKLPYPAINRASGMVLEEPISINPSISDRVNKAILKGMELEPENRPQTMQQWLHLLTVPVSSPQTPKQKTPKPDDLSSDKNVDYSKLRDLLRDGKWKEADEETLAVMLKASARKNQGWLNIESIKKFPGTDLRTIDQLWVKYSQGNFGFSVQKRIWESVGGQLNAEHKIALKFAKTVGWYLDKSWIDEDKLQFTIDNANKGHLPSVYKAGLYNIYRNWYNFFALLWGLSTLLLLMFILLILVWNGLSLFFRIPFFPFNNLNSAWQNFFLALIIFCFFVGMYASMPLYYLEWRTTMKGYTALFARSEL